MQANTYVIFLDRQYLTYMLAPINDRCQMAQHFLLSAAAKTLSLASVFTMKDAEAETTFRRSVGPIRTASRFARIVAALTPRLPPP